MQGKADLPPRHFYSLEEINDPLVPATNVPRRNTIKLIAMSITVVITMIKLLMLTNMLTPHRRIMSMVYLMDPLVEILMLVTFPLHLQVLLPLLNHLLVCGWLRRTNSSVGKCLRWIRMGHGQWLH